MLEFRQLDVEASQRQLATLNIIGWFGAQTQINIVLGSGAFQQTEVASCKVSFSRSLLKKKEYFFQQLIKDQKQLVVYTVASVSAAQPNTTLQLSAGSHHRHFRMLTKQLFNSVEFEVFYHRIRSQLQTLETEVLTQENRLAVARLCAKKELTKFIWQCQSKYRISFDEAIELVEELVPELKVAEIMSE